MTTQKEPCGHTRNRNRRRFTRRRLRPDHVGADLTRRLEVLIIVHVIAPGLGTFLERKLMGTPASLQALVEEQHDREGIRSA